MLSAIPQIAAEVDQVDPTQLLAFELLARRKTLIETMLGNAKLAGAKAGRGAANHWVGCPMVKDDYALSTVFFRAHGTRDLKTDAAIAKELWKAKAN